MTWMQRTYTSPTWRLARDLAPWFGVGLAIGAAVDILTRIFC